MMTGGVARNVGVVQALEKKAGCKVRVSAYAQVNGAIGAALIAAREWGSRTHGAEGSSG
jgi:activator of 2-hydroxyglutaryl-CoA dehydratase